MNTLAAAEEVGISYRQLDFWITRGYIKPALPNPGSGNPRSINGGEVEVLRWMARLVRAGIKPDAAAKHARELVSGGTAHLAGGFTLLPPVEVEGATA